MSGCVHRSLTIKTDPPGAKVYVNDTLLDGETPLTYDFLWYGWYRVTLRKEGYERVDDRQRIRCPAHLWIPFDLVAELLPFHMHDRREWSYTLTPVQELPRPTPPPVGPAEWRGPRSNEEHVATVGGTTGGGAIQQEQGPDATP